MAKNRSLYNAIGVYSSADIASTGSGQHVQLKRVQSLGDSVEIQRTDVQQFGNLARISSLVTSPPNVSIDMTYLLTDGYNEKALGFHVQNPAGFVEGNFASGHMVVSSGLNIFAVEAAEGYDLNNETSLSGKAVVGLGNCFLSNYEVSAAVGGFPTVSVSFEASNKITDTYYYQGALTGVNSPAVNVTNGQAYPQNTGVRLPMPSSGDGTIVLRPGDITFSFGNMTGTASGTASPFHTLAGTDGVRVQNFSLSVPLSRTPIEQLGSRFPYARPVDFPVTATMSISAIANEQVKRNLAAFLDDSSTNDVAVTITQPNGSQGMKYTLKGAQFVSESSNLGIGDNKTVDMTFTAQVGGPTTLTAGVYCSGSHSGAVFS